MTRYRTIIRDMIAVEVPKGKRDIYKIAAQELGLSLSRLVQNGVEEYIKNHVNEVPIAIEESAKVEEKIKEAVSRLGEKSAKVGEKFTEAELQINENFLKLPKSIQKRFAGLIQDFAKYAEQKKPPKWRKIF